MIRYPHLPQNARIGVTAPSSGVPEHLHPVMHQAIRRLEGRGYSLTCGETVWTQHKGKSAPASVRAEEFQRLMTSDHIDLIIPPWGGELLSEILPLLGMEQLPDKWVLGYSDTSVLLLAMTLRTGMATAHGTNLVDLRAEPWDALTAKWEEVLCTGEGGVNVQESSELFQKEWNFDGGEPFRLELTESTRWQTVSGQTEKMEGRLLGGCIDVIRHLAGTPYGDVQRFRERHIPGEPVLWYLENCEMSAIDLRRSLVQLKLAGWFENCAGVLFGRSPAGQPVEGYEQLDAYRDLADELGVSVVYDIDCGHVPPQLTIINGAYAKVEIVDGQGRLEQHFRP